MVRMIDVRSSESAGEGMGDLTGGQTMACTSCSFFHLLILSSLEVLSGKRETTGIVSGKKIPYILAGSLSSGNGQLFCPCSSH